MLEAIKNRRSCRKFDSERMVEEEKIREIVAAGLLAPSAKNLQNSEMIVIKDKSVRDRLSEINSEIMGREKGLDPFYGAPIIIMVISKKFRTAQNDGSVMMENILLEATNQGLASIWINRAKEELEREDVRELLKPCGLDLTEYEGIGHAAIGYSEFEYPELKNRDKRVHYI